MHIGLRIASGSGFTYLPNENKILNLFYPRDAEFLRFHSKTKPKQYLAVIAITKDIRKLNDLEKPLNLLIAKKRNVLIGGFIGKNGFEFDASYTLNFRLKNELKIVERLNQYNTQESALIISPKLKTKFFKNPKF